MESNYELQLKSFGECMIEFSKTSSGELRRSIGGDTFNTASMAALCGLKVEYTTKVGNDPLKNFLIEEMSSYPISLNLIESSLKNGSYRIDTDIDGERSFFYDRTDSAASTLSSEDFNRDYLENCRGFYNSGITMALSKDCEEALVSLYKEACNKKIPTFFDLNYREKLWNEAAALKAMTRIRDFVDVLFISDEDLNIFKSMYGENFNIKGRIIIQRKGADGCVVHTENGSEKVSGIPAKPIDTTGAGDIFSGTFIANYLLGRDLVESAEIANRFAAKHTEFRGGTPNKGII